MFAARLHTSIALAGLLALAACQKRDAPLAPGSYRISMAELERINRFGYTPYTDEELREMGLRSGHYEFFAADDRECKKLVVDIGPDSTALTTVLQWSSQNRAFPDCKKPAHAAQHDFKRPKLWAENR
jgi:hypothetical protein